MKKQKHTMLFKKADPTNYIKGNLLSLFVYAFICGLIIVTESFWERTIFVTGMFLYMILEKNSENKLIIKFCDYIKLNNSQNKNALMGER